MEEELNLASLPKYLSDEAEAWSLLERLRWPDGEPVCPHCGTKDAKHYFIAARSGERRTRTGAVTFRRLWRCRDKDCRRQFSVLIGTVFESSKLPVSKWLLALWLMSASKNGVAALELQRHLGIAYQTAWFVGHRLREAMRREPLVSLFSGTVVSDETWVGGSPKNRHGGGRYGTGKRGQHDKTPVLALVHRESGEVRARVIPDVTGATLLDAIAEQADLPTTRLHTDSASAYGQVGRKAAAHETITSSGNTLAAAGRRPTPLSRSSPR